MSIKINEAIIVEGKYDKIKLMQIFDATIVCTDGFGIFKSDDKLAYIRQLAEKNGIIIFTDPDGAGKVIRGYLKGAIPNGKIYNAYIPDVPGKEKRKVATGKAGLLGVEGVTDQLIIDAVMSCGINGEASSEGERITKTDFYELGLSGGKNSSALRVKLAKKLNLPSNISPNGLLDALNALYSKDELIRIISEI